MPPIPGVGPRPGGSPIARIDLDHNATTPLAPEAFAEMLPYFAEQAGNPSSAHAPGREARVAVDRARARIARAVGARPDQVLLTSGGTEANNLALLGAARGSARRGRHLLASAVEHASVLEPLARLRGEGFEVGLLPVDGTGRLDPAEVRRAIRPDTILVSVMAANNETGALQPVEEILDLLPPAVLLHCDAAQLFGKMPATPAVRRAHLLALSGHKVYGPKGAGALVVRDPASPEPLLLGGGQERGLRAGTENVPAIVGFAAALERAVGRAGEYAATVGPIARRLLDAILSRVPGACLRGPVDPALRLPNTIAISFPVPDGRALVAAFDLAGVSVSSGSACSSGAPGPSHVLLAMGASPALATRTVRFSLGWGIDEETAREAVERIVVAVRRMIGGISPKMLGAPIQQPQDDGD